MTSILKVSSIQDPQNSNTALQVDTSRRITTPTRPSFFAYKTTSDQSDQDYTDYTQIQFDATQHNIGNCYSTSTYKFTAPVNGIYHFNWQVRVSNVTTANYIWAALRKNGNIDWGNSNFIHANLEDPQGGTYQTPGMSVTVQVSANDEIDVALVVNNDGSSRIQNGTTCFSGHLVG